MWEIEVEDIVEKGEEEEMEWLKKEWKKEKKKQKKKKWSKTGKIEEEVKPKLDDVKIVEEKTEIVTEEVWVEEVVS